MLAARVMFAKVGFLHYKSKQPVLKLRPKSAVWSQAEMKRTGGHAHETGTFWRHPTKTLAARGLHQTHPERRQAQTRECGARGLTQEDQPHEGLTPEVPPGTCLLSRLGTKERLRGKNHDNKYAWYRHSAATELKFGFWDSSKQKAY